MCTGLRTANDKLRAARKEDQAGTESGEQAEITRLKSEVARLRELLRKVNDALMTSDGIVEMTGEVDDGIDASDNDMPAAEDIGPASGGRWGKRLDGTQNVHGGERNVTLYICSLPRHARRLTSSSPC